MYDKFVRGDVVVDLVLFFVGVGSLVHTPDALLTFMYCESCSNGALAFVHLICSDLLGKTYSCRWYSIFCFCVITCMALRDTMNSNSAPVQSDHSIQCYYFRLLQFVVFMSSSNFTFWASWQRFILAILPRIQSFECMHSFSLNISLSISKCAL